MQDGKVIPAEEAGAWLRKNKPEIDIRWTVNEEHDEDTYRRLLKLLFSPRPDSRAA
ncbi:hypothetical protein [Streptomyces halobius]|uniref:Uncharacterized protein n=1 Tax=Streptomyces halobius TaxID=2879846 RepID=A0ABY4M2I4_9ACTN|nr:hypothetical protein [Streptomyces halobius]UQA91672.1 hypothetical protein K9S39_07160 [Streptomyces halobius]